MEPQPDTHDARAIVMLARVATTASTAVEAIGEQCVEEARRRIDHLRMQWSTLLDGSARQFKSRHAQVHTHAGAEALHHGTEVLSICGEVITEWIRTRYEALVGNSDPLSVDDWQVVLDRALPLRWNFRCDILVVHGSLPEALVQAILARGQVRTVHIGPAPPDSFDDSVVHLNDPQAVSRYVATIQHSFPKRHASLDLGEGVMSPEQVMASDALVSRAIKNLRMNWATWRRFSSTWFQQGLTNLPAVAVAPDLSFLAKRYGGRPAIVISPGPSLDGNIEWLRRAQGKALLLAPLQVLRRLYRENIRPDLAVVLDSQDQTCAPLDFLAGIEPSYLPDLLASTSAHPHVVAAFRRVYFFTSKSPIDQLVAGANSQAMPSLPAGSVSISCFKLALHWNCSPIMLVGQDLAFSGQQRYADSAGSKGSRIPAEPLTLPGYHGGVVQTAIDYFQFHHQFQELAVQVRNTRHEITLLNCTEGGAQIAGFEQVPLSEALDIYVESLLPLTHPVSHHQDLPAPELREGLIRSLRARLAHVRKAIRLGEECELLARQTSFGGASQRNRLVNLDKALRAQVEPLKHLMLTSADEIDDALAAQEVFDCPDSDLDSSRRLREAALTGLRELEALLLPALNALTLKHDPQEALNYQSTI